MKSADLLKMLYESLAEFENALSEVQKNIKYVRDGIADLTNNKDLKKIFLNNECDRDDCNVTETDLNILEGINDIAVPLTDDETAPLTDDETAPLTDDETVPLTNDETVPFEKVELFFGAPSGEGFEMLNRLNSRESVKTLYVVEQISPYEALFYPVKEKIVRLKNNISTLIEPVCEIKGNIENCSSFSVEEDGYGKLILDNDYWRVKNKCVIKCSE